MADKLQRWYPSQAQMKDLPSLERTIRQMLTQHYDLVDSVLATREQVANQRAAPNPNGPSSTKLLGLPVAPVDVQTLADGATLKFSKKNGNFFFG